VQTAGKHFVAENTLTRNEPGCIANEIYNFASCFVVGFEYALCNVFNVLTGLIFYGDLIRPAQFG
jgi:hypothetical protein